MGGRVLVLVAITGVLGVGCATATPRLHADVATLAADPDWIGLADVPLVRQQGTADCGAAVLTMVLRYWGQEATLDAIARVFAAPDGSTAPIRAGDLRNFARASGLHAYLLSAELADLQHQLARRRPVIVGLRRATGGVPTNHYELVVGVNPSKQLVVTMDPAAGLRVVPLTSFLSEWAGSDRLALITIPDARARPAAPRPRSAMPATLDAQRMPGERHPYY